jgi:phosphohistidine phosphatase SixA
MQEEGSADAGDGPKGHHGPRRIAVMRHGKAEQAGRTDYERELADRGHADSEEAGGWLAGQGFRPDFAMVSAARRTVGTWESVAAGGGFEIEPCRPRRDLPRGGRRRCLRFRNDRCDHQRGTNRTRDGSSKRPNA